MCIFRLITGFFLSLLFYTVLTDTAFAADDIDIDDVARNIVLSMEGLPALIAAGGYLTGLLFMFTGLVKLKDHVENPTQTPLKTPVVRLLVGGAFFSLPIVYEAMYNAIAAAEDVSFDPGIFSLGGAISGILGFLGDLLGGLTMDLNALMSYFIGSIEKIPGLFSAVAYLLGLIMGFTGLAKLKDHVENPDQTPLRESVIRLIIGGALFALPTVFTAASNMITGGEGVGLLGNLSSAASLLGWISSPYSGESFFGIPLDICNPLGTTAGSSICGVVLHAGAFPAFLSAISYVLGIIFAIWGLLKIRDHVLNPTQTSIWEGPARIFAAGAFFALPVFVEAIRGSVTPIPLSVMTMVPITGYNETAAECEGLDGALYCMMADITGPVHNVLNFFSFCAGTFLIMIGISRLIKSAQDGARGPGGIGTLMTFLTGGALISYNEFLRAFTGTFFTDPRSKTYAIIRYAGEAGEEMNYAHTIISAVLKFMIIVGLISFVRGLFIIRGVAEGNQQASMMAGITHIVGGTLAVNLGPLLNAVQETLGITDYGILFI